jgi:hypothetical protein
LGVLEGVAVHPKAHLPPCEEKKRLRTLYRLASERHVHAINEAVRVRGRVSKDEHDRLWALAEHGC